LRGRKRVPTQLRKLHGNPTHASPLPTQEPVPKGNLNEPPDWMTETQKEGWRYALQHSPTGLLKLIDRGALIVWVVAEAIHRQAAVELQATGLLVDAGPNSSQQVNSPFLGIINRQAAIMLKAASDLGFTPASRPKMMVNPTAGAGFDDQSADSLEDFLNSDPGPPTIN
jgi:P27 family predicted phage terminase small subunit